MEVIPNAFIKQSFSSREVFLLKERISRLAQIQIINLVKSQGEPCSGIQKKGAGFAPFWKVGVARWLDYDSFNCEMQNWFLKNPHLVGDWAYFARKDSNIHWKWQNNELGRAVSKVVSPIAELFNKLTRVNVFLQVPGQSIRAHRDLMPGNFYNDLESEVSTKRGDQPLHYIGSDWFQKTAQTPQNSLHSQQNFLALKIPLSENPDESGEPFFILNQNTQVYNPRDNYYFMNESLYHGANPVDYWRGVIFIDGILNMKKVGVLQSEGPPVPYRAIQNIN